MRKYTLLMDGKAYVHIPTRWCDELINIVMVALQGYIFEPIRLHVTLQFTMISFPSLTVTAAAYGLLSVFIYATHTRYKALSKADTLQVSRMNNGNSLQKSKIRH
jgi:hypothetical protein